MSELKLTREQQAAVDHRGGTLLVSAAAGSGKTKVLVDRVLGRVTDPSQQCNVDDFLMITFTQAAAAELRGKLIAALSERLSEQPDNRHLQRQMSRVYLAQISTVHAFCGVILREYAHTLELPADFRICDEEEAKQLRQRALTATLEDAYRRVKSEPQIAAALDMLGAGRDDSAINALIVNLFSGVQCYPDPAARLGALEKMLDVSDCTDAGETVWGRFLIDEFRRYLSVCAASLEEACRVIDATPALAAYAPTFYDNLRDVRALAAQNTWEAMHSGTIDFGTLRRIYKCPEPEKQSYVQTLRKRAVNGIRARQEKFSLTSEEALADLRRSGDALHGLLLLVRSFSERYRQSKLQRHVLDYNDLEHETLRLLTHSGGLPTAAAREVSQHYAEIMVDEYQDTNSVQDAIFRAISRDEKNLFFVGDVKQSIYRFRLADPGIFLEKYSRFADYTQSGEGEPRKILLSDNFRSHPAILAAANDVFRLTMTPRTGGLRYGDAEALHANRPNTDMGEPPVELHCIDMASLPKHPPVERAQIEAEFVACRVAELLNGSAVIPEGENLRPIRPEDIVILMRSLSGKAQIYVDALQRHGISAVSGSDDLFSAEEIRFLVALLQVIDNPRQDIPLVTVLLSPAACFTADELALIRSENRDGSLYDALCASARASDFCRLLGELRDLSQRVSLRRLLDEIIARLMLRAIYGGRLGQARCAGNLDTFLTLADRYESGGHYGLSGFLRYLDAMREKGVASEDAAASGAVRLMTVHKSKGLEFPVVILADLAKGFNHTDARAPVLADSELGVGCSILDTARRITYPTIAKGAISRRIDMENKSEEMRVLYVAMTRAKYRLIMTCCGRRVVSVLKNIARDVTLPPSDAMIEDADSLAQWILTAAMLRTEAGQLFEVAGKPEHTYVSEYPWRIAMHDGLAYMESDGQSVIAPETAKCALPPFLVRLYGHDAAVGAPTKLTATQLKGRELDTEAADGAPPAELLHFPKPRFPEGERPLTPAERGTAIHLAMQFLRYENCGSRKEIEKELSRLGAERFLSGQQLAAVDPEKLLRFFTSELGRFVRSAPKVVREFKFSVLEDAAIYDPALAGEQILLQGVTDCCVIEPDGLTILDFKSDRIAAGAEGERAVYYRGQLDAYGRALSRIFALPVKRRILYFFATDTAIEA